MSREDASFVETLTPTQNKVRLVATTTLALLRLLSEMVAEVGRMEAAMQRLAQEATAANPDTAAGGPGSGAPTQVPSAPGANAEATLSAATRTSLAAVLEHTREATGHANGAVAAAKKAAAAARVADEAVRTGDDPPHDRFVVYASAWDGDDASRNADLVPDAAGSYQQTFTADNALVSLVRLLSKSDQMFVARLMGVGISPKGYRRPTMDPTWLDIVRAVAPIVAGELLALSGSEYGVYDDEGAPRSIRWLLRNDAQKAVEKWATFAKLPAGAAKAIVDYVEASLARERVLPDHPFQATYVALATLVVSAMLKRAYRHAPFSMAPAIMQALHDTLGKPSPGPYPTLLAAARALLFPPKPMGTVQLPPLPAGPGGAAPIPSHEAESMYVAEAVGLSELMQNHGAPGGVVGTGA
jgi:hypothetical protein